MKKWVLAASMVIAVGCSGGDGDEQIYELTTGTYTLSSIDVETDGCQLDPAGSFTSLALSVDGDTVTIGVVILIRDGNSLQGEGATDLDQSPINCLLDFAATASGRVTGSDEISLSEEIVLTENSGTECDQVGPVFPCSSEFSFDATK